MVTVGRLITAMVTPFDEQGEVEYAQARHLASSLLDSGSDGLVISGTTGESPTLTKDEKLRLFREIKAELGDRGAVVAGTGNYSTAESIELTQAAEKVGVDAALLVVPYYNKPTQEGLYQHFRAIAESTALPCILYNVPSRTITSLSWETTLRLAQVDNIIGVKEASGDFDQIAHIIAGAPRGFRVWSGNDSDTFGIMTMGGYGVVSVASHLVGLQIKGMMDLILAGRTSQAAAEHLRLTPIFKGLFIVSNPIPVKYSVNYVGFPVGKPRLPLTEPDAKTAEQLQAMLKGYRIDLPVAAGA
ncbi:MAG: 4-hydroxy-tetrahydrodipicolinate synthase [Chloroflexi bacterium]|nr:4-hydroxy-tetrahydrodipicolinate synthase [Chloroflexota bacterium]